MKREYLQPTIERIVFVGRADVCQNPFDNPASGGFEVPPAENILHTSPV